MLIKTHLAITIFLVLILLPFVEAKIIFVIISLLATYIPDIDSRYSKVGYRKIARILQIFTKHRGLIHSFSLLLTLTLILALFFPTIALPFFLGYSSHLLADSFTLDGIIPFYPLKKKTYGFVKTGGKIEHFILISFIAIDLFLLIRLL